MSLNRTDFPEYEGGLTDLPGLKVGHFTDPRRPTGCTVILAEAGATAGVDIRGSAPGTRETDLLDPVNTVPHIHAITLAGGSAFGLDAACGVVRYLEEKGVGHPTAAIPVPIVPAAILFDLALGDPSVRPDSRSGYEACLKAGRVPVAEGSVGCGAGATVGKLLGRGRAMKGGLGSASMRWENITVAALAAVNALGNVVDPKSGQVLAGVRTVDGFGLLGVEECLKVPYRKFVMPSVESTTLVVVATNARFDKAGMTKIAQMCHDGFARAINPVHLPYDGDVAFALSTGEIEEASLAQVGAMAAEVTARAIVRAVVMAEGVAGFPAHRDLFSIVSGQ
jgi:L-aminopeptidase/D-esterase-like protein